MIIFIDSTDAPKAPVTSTQPMLWYELFMAVVYQISIHKYSCLEDANINHLQPSSISQN